MKTNLLYFILIVGTISISSCSSEPKNEPANDTMATVDSGKSDSAEVKAETTSGITVEQIDLLRSEIEKSATSPIEVSTSTLREKIKQKWSKIHFYVRNDSIIKIKTYPHSDITKRTEEFYVHNNALALVVIEDDGEGEKGKAKNDLDKLYYFDQGKLISESHGEDEKEYGVRNSDAEELLAEFNEYIEIFKNKK